MYLRPISGKTAIFILATVQQLEPIDGRVNNLQK
jgi:hypothetical protein